MSHYLYVTPSICVHLARAFYLILFTALISDWTAFVMTP